MTTNRPSLPASGFALPDDDSKAPLAVALGGFASALAEVARLSIGIAQSLTVRRREIEGPADDVELTEPAKK